MIQQKYYPSLEVDTKEKDIVQIWMHSINDPQVVQIEREKLKEIIEILQFELTNNN